MCSGDILRPHRLIGGPSLIDPILNPNDKYNKPKVPATTPAVQRQAYKDPVSRASLSSGDPEKRRRAMGVVTGPQGVTEEASTTKRVKLGGDQALNPTIVGGGGASVTPIRAPTPAISATAAVTPRLAPVSSGANLVSIAGRKPRNRFTRSAA